MVFIRQRTSMVNAISEENAVRAANEAFYQALSARLDRGHIRRLRA
jgi:hypothetical protein